jgi:hypothetical protein
VYLESSPSPANRPARSQSHPSPLRRMSATTQTASAQKSTDGESGVMRMAPAPIRIVALSQRAPRAEVAMPKPRFRAVAKIAQEVIAAAATESARTPNVPSPKSVVDAHIHQATIGGWS